MFADNGLVNLVGGCCGSTPAHIRLALQKYFISFVRLLFIEPLRRLCAIHHLESVHWISSVTHFFCQVHTSNYMYLLYDNLCTHVHVHVGLEPMKVNIHTNFVNIGERCNVAGSKRFCRLITTGKYEVHTCI